MIYPHDFHGLVTIGIQIEAVLPHMTRVDDLSEEIPTFTLAFMLLFGETLYAVRFLLFSLEITSSIPIGIPRT